MRRHADDEERKEAPPAAQPESRSFSPLAPPPTKTKDTSTSLSREYCCKALLSSCHSAVLTNWHQHYEVVRPNCGRNPNRIADFFSISFLFRQTMDLLPSFLPFETGTTRRCPRRLGRFVRKAIRARSSTEIREREKSWRKGARRAKTLILITICTDFSCSIWGLHTEEDCVKLAHMVRDSEDAYFTQLLADEFILLSA